MPGFHAQYRRDAHTTYSTKDLQVQFMGICQQHQLPCLPTPFPLCAGLETNEGYWNYFDDYDYPVQLSVPGGSSYERTVQVDLTVSYTAEKSPRNRNARPYSSWKVKALGTDFLLADVRLESSVLQTDFGLKFVSDGKYLQKALALSSETGYPITIGIVLRGKDRRVGFTVHQPDRAPEVIGYAS